MNYIWHIWCIDSCTSNYTVDGVTYGSSGSLIIAVTHWWVWRFWGSREQESSLICCWDSVTLLRIATFGIVTPTTRLGGRTEDKLTGDTNLAWTTGDPRLDIATLSSLLSDTGSCLVVFWLLAWVVLDQTSKTSCTHSSFIGKPSTSLPILKNNFIKCYSPLLLSLTDGAHWRQTPQGSVCSWPDGQFWRRDSTSGQRLLQ